MARRTFPSARRAVRSFIRVARIALYLVLVLGLLAPAVALGTGLGRIAETFEETSETRAEQNSDAERCSSDLSSRCEAGLRQLSPRRRRRSSRILALGTRRRPVTRRRPERALPCGHRRLNGDLAPLRN